MFHPFRSSEKQDDLFSRSSSILEHENHAGTATSTSQDFEIVGHKLTYSNIDDEDEKTGAVEEFVDLNKNPEPIIYEEVLDSPSSTQNLSIQVSNLSGSIFDDLPPVSGNSSLDDDEIILPPPRLSFSMHPDLLVKDGFDEDHDYCDDDEEEEEFLAPSLLQAAKKAKKTLPKKADYISVIDEQTKEMSIKGDRNEPGKPEAKTEAMERLLPLPIPPVPSVLEDRPRQKGPLMPRRIMFGGYLVMGLMFVMWVSCKVFSGQPAALAPSDSTNGISASTTPVSQLQSTLEVKYHEFVHKEEEEEDVVDDTDPMIAVGDDFAKKEFFSTLIPLVASLPVQAEIKDILLPSLLTGWSVVIRARALQSVIQAIFGWFKWIAGLVAAFLISLLVFWLVSFFAAVDPPATAVQTAPAVCRVVKNEPVLECGLFKTQPTGAHSRVKDEPLVKNSRPCSAAHFLEQERNLTKFDELCDFLHHCDSHLSRGGRRSRAAPSSTVQIAQDTSAYNCLTKMELHSIGRDLGVSNIKCASNKATLIAAVVAKYEAVLKGFTVTEIKTILKAKNIQPMLIVQKDDMIKRAVEAAF